MSSNHSHVLIEIDAVKCYHVSAGYKCLLTQGRAKIIKVVLPGQADVPIYDVAFLVVNDVVSHPLLAKTEVKYISDTSFEFSKPANEGLLVVLPESTPVEKIILFENCLALYARYLPSSNQVRNAFCLVNETGRVLGIVNEKVIQKEFVPAQAQNQLPIKSESSVLVDECDGPLQVDATEEGVDYMQTQFSSGVGGKMPVHIKLKTSGTSIVTMSSSAAVDSVTQYQDDSDSEYDAQTVTSISSTESFHTALTSISIAQETRGELNITDELDPQRVIKDSSCRNIYDSNVEPDRIIDLTPFKNKHPVLTTPLRNIPVILPVTSCPSFSRRQSLRVTNEEMPFEIAPSSSSSSTDNHLCKKAMFVWQVVSESVWRQCRRVTKVIEQKSLQYGYHSQFQETRQIAKLMWERMKQKGRALRMPASDVSLVYFDQDGYLHPTLIDDSCASIKTDSA